MKISIDTPFGRYRPIVPSSQEMERAASVMGKAVEAIAIMNHDKWAVERIAQGWRYGPQRDDQKKLHPDLVAYKHLPESEKKFDIEGAKAIVAMLLRIGLIQTKSRPTPTAQSD